MGEKNEDNVEKVEKKRACHHCTPQTDLDIAVQNSTSIRKNVFATNRAATRSGYTNKRDESEQKQISRREMETRTHWQLSISARKFIDT